MTHIRGVHPGQYQLWLKHCFCQSTSQRLPENVTIRIYNIAGELIMIEENINSGFFNWNAKNEAGEKVASGVYIYIITDDKGGIKKGKIAIIR
jgi:flagellar hook assembly protein FlgD